MDQQTPLFDLQIDQLSNSYLSETSKWAKFIAIVGIIFCGLMIVIGIFMGSFIASMYSRAGMPVPGGFGGVMTIVYIICAVIFFFPYFYLYRFASYMQVALRNNDQQTLTNSFSNLKSCFKFVGIVTMVALVIYALAIIFSILGVAIGRM